MRLNISRFFRGLLNDSKVVSHGQSMRAFKTALMGVLVIWVGGLALSVSVFGDWATRGQFGDSFGFINALFSGLAFVGLIYTVWLQRDELELQREELRLQREEMAASRGELANQVAAQHALFEATSAQIVVAAVQAQIEAIKMDAEKYHPGMRDDSVKKIDVLAGSLRELANRVEGTRS